MSTILGILVLMYLLITCISVLLYIFNSVGLYKIANREKDKNAYIAWVPYLNRITESKIAFGSSTLGIVMVALQVLSVVFMIITIFSTKMQTSVLVLLGLISFIFSSIFKVIDFIGHYKMYEKYGKSSVIMTILDIISLGILGPLFIFAIRNNEKKQ